MKKIVHITNDLQRLGGVQRLLVDLMTLQNSNFEFEVILTRGDNEYVNELVELGIPVFHKRDIGLLGIVNRLNKADLVHAHLFPSLYISLFTVTPTIITEHNPHYRRRDLPMVSTLESILFRKYKKILCISKGVQDSFSKMVNIDSSVTEIVHNGVDLARFSQRPKPYPANGSIIKIGMVGRLVPQKDIITLIKLIASLDHSYELHLAGDGELKNTFENYANSLRVSQKIIFHGQVDNIPEFLDSIDIYIQSSFEEGFGLAVVEAMAAGLPCLATNVDGLNNVIDDKYTFDVGDVHELVYRVERLAQSESLYKESAEYSVKQANKFSIAYTAMAHTNIYHQCIIDQ